MACVGCGEAVPAGARFCSTCGHAVSYTVPPPAPNPQRRPLPPAGLDGLYRPREHRMIAGVCIGFAVRFGWDVSIVRLVLVLSLVFGVGTPAIAYLVAWVLMPNGQLALPAQASGGGPGSMRV